MIFIFFTKKSEFWINYIQILYSLKHKWDLNINEQLPRSLFAGQWTLDLPIPRIFWDEFNTLPNTPDKFFWVESSSLQHKYVYATRELRFPFVILKLTHANWSV